MFKLLLLSLSLFPLSFWPLTNTEYSLEVKIRVDDLATICNCSQRNDFGSLLKFGAVLQMQNVKIYENFVNETCSASDETLKLWFFDVPFVPNASCIRFSFEKISPHSASKNCLSNGTECLPIRNFNETQIQVEFLNITVVATKTETLKNHTDDASMTKEEEDLGRNGTMQKPITKPPSNDSSIDEHVDGLWQAIMSAVRSHVGGISNESPKCPPNKYGKKCDVNCNPPTPGEYYYCGPKTGQKICLAGFIGPDCMNYISSEFSNFSIACDFELEKFQNAQHLEYLPPTNGEYFSAFIALCVATGVLLISVIVLSGWLLVLRRRLAAAPSNEANVNFNGLLNGPSAARYLTTDQRVEFGPQ